MMTCDAAVNLNLQLTSSETISELLCGLFIFSTEMCLTDSFFSHLQVQKIDNSGSGDQSMSLHQMLDYA